jgi:uncharacterized protein
MKAARAVLLALLLGWIFPALFPALALVAVPQLTGRVVDQTGTLSSGDIAQLTQTLADLQTRKGSQIAVLIVPTTDGEPIEQFSLRVAEAWKIGRKKVDDGALLVVAKNDRRLRIEIGYGLEGVLTDVTSKRIIDEIITPKFKSGDFAGGISAGVNRMIGLINGEKLPEPEPPHWDSSNFDAFNPFLLFFAFVISSILRSALGRLIGSIATGGVVAVLVWFLFGSFVAAFAIGLLAFFIAIIIDVVPTGGGSTSSGWSGGSSSGGGWSSGSSSGDSGGFSGGGGSFGGGGASGSW